MRAVGTPGTTRDIMPKWSVDEATAYSKAECQRGERVEAEIRRRNRGAEKTDGGGRKGKGVGEGKGQEGQPPIAPFPGMGRAYSKPEPLKEVDPSSQS